MNPAGGEEELPVDAAEVLRRARTPPLDQVVEELGLSEDVAALDDGD